MADAKPRINTPKAGGDDDAKIKAQVELDLKEEAKKNQEAAEAQQKADRADGKAAELTPLGRTLTYAGGTLKGGLNGMATGGRFGFWAALIAMVVVGFGAGLSASIAGQMLFLGIPAIMLVGVAIGGVVGLVTGGPGELARKERGDDGHAPALGPKRRAYQTMNYQEAREAQQDHQENIFDKLQQQERVDRHEASTYWRDQVQNQPSASWSRGV